MADEQKPQIPTREQIAKLPMWAQVAYAARCARRVQPLFLTAWPDAPQEPIEAIEKAITLAEASSAATTASNSTSASDFRATANAAAHAAALVDSKAARAAGHAAAVAAETAAVATPGLIVIPQPLVDAASLTDALTVATEGAAAVITRIRNDFEVLRALAEREGWDDETTVPQQVFGPMWPEGVPKGWPVESTSEGQFKPAYVVRKLKAQTADPAREQKVVLKLRIPPLEDTPENRARLKHEIGSLIEAASELHVAHGGSGLKIKRLHAYAKDRIAQPVGGDQ